MKQFQHRSVHEPSTTVSVRRPPQQETAPHGAPYLLSVRKAAEYMGRTEKAVRHLYERRIVTPLRIDGRVFLDRREIDALFEQARAQAS